MQILDDYKEKAETKLRDLDELVSSLQMQVQQPNVRHAICVTMTDFVFNESPTNGQ